MKRTTKRPKSRRSKEDQFLRMTASSDGKHSMSAKAWMRPPNPKRFTKHVSKPHSPGT